MIISVALTYGMAHATSAQLLILLVQGSLVGIVLPGMQHTINR